MLGYFLLFCLTVGAVANSSGSSESSIVTKNTKKEDESHSLFSDIKDFAENSVATTYSSSSMTTELTSQPFLSKNVSVSAVRYAEKKVLALYESHPQAISLLDAIQLQEIGHSSLVRALHDLELVASSDESLLTSLSYVLDHVSQSKLDSELSSIEDSRSSVVQAVERVISAFKSSLSPSVSTSELLQSMDHILMSNKYIMTQLAILGSVVEPGIAGIVKKLEAYDNSYSSIVTDIESLISAEETDVELQSAISNFERHKQTESTIASELFEMKKSPLNEFYLDKDEVDGHTSTYEEAGRIASLATSRPSLVCELSSIESLELAHSSVQRYVQSIMSAEDTSALASVENMVKQTEFQTCSFAASIESQLASFVELEIAYPYLAQDIVKIHKIKEEYSGFSAALSYISSYAYHHAKQLSEIYFDQSHPSVAGGQSQLASLKAADSTLFSMLSYVNQIEASCSGLTTALSVVRVVKLADPSVVSVIEYIVHEQSSEMSAAKYIGTLISSHPLILSDFSVVASYETRYPRLATYEEVVSTAYATEPTNVLDLEEAVSSPSKASKISSLASVIKSESSLWSAVQYTEKVSLAHSAFRKAAESLASITRQSPSAVQQIIFEKEMDPSLVSAEESIASVKFRHPSISHDVDYIGDLEMLTDGLQTALGRFEEAQSTSPTLLHTLIEALKAGSSCDSSYLDALELGHATLFHDLEILHNVVKKHPNVIKAYSSISSVKNSSPQFTREFEQAESLTESTEMSNRASIEEVQSTHPSFITDAEFLLHQAAAHERLMSDFNLLETAQVSSASTVDYLFQAARNHSVAPTSYVEELIESYPTLWEGVEYVNQLGVEFPEFAHDLVEVLSIVKSHPHIVADLLSIEAGTNPSVTAAEKLGVEEEQSLCQTAAVPRVQEVEEEIIEPKPKFVSTLKSSS